MKSYQKKALKILDNFEESEYKTALIDMISYVVDRKI
jgi:geranylgeranyl pyrophosphate synthase